MTLNFQTIARVSDLSVFDSVFGIENGHADFFS